MQITRIEASEKGSRAAIYQNVAYLSGLVGLDFKADIAVQTEQALQRVDEYLTKVGSSRDLILNATVYIKSDKLYQDMNLVWQNWLKGYDKPTRTTVVTDLAHPDLLIEVSIIAVVSKKE